MRIALAQINSTMGDFVGNRQKIQACILRSQERRCDLVVFPELALFGYAPNDLLERRHLVSQQLAELTELCETIPKGMAMLVGAVIPVKSKTWPAQHKNQNPTVIRPYFNAAVWIEKGKKPRAFAKQFLPAYDIFDENRHFEPGNLPENRIRFLGKNLHIAICEDLWSATSVFSDLQYSNSFFIKKPRDKIDLIVSINASPFSVEKADLRLKLAKQISQKMKSNLLYVNMVGAQDEIIFDGGSFVTNPSGKLISQSLHFEEDLNVFDLSKSKGGFRPPAHSSNDNPTERLRQALVLGIRDFAQKLDFHQLHLGLSGGIDSAVAACLAVDALGPSKVSTFGLPGPFSAPESLVLARQCAANLGCEFQEFSIVSAYDLLKKEIDSQFSIDKFQSVHENIQARLRGLFLMSFSNLKKSLLLTTGNKVEFATGYATLYGDMCGGLAPLGDLLKRQIYDLAAHYNSQAEIIPHRIILRPPTAELKANQKDQDTLPPYDELDDLVEKIVVQRRPAKSKREIWLAQTLANSEFKRWQAPPILRVSAHSFGRGRRMPIVNKAKL